MSGREQKTVFPGGLPLSTYAPSLRRGEGCVLNGEHNMF